MKIQTLSIIAGSHACNARCPFCISKMTPNQGIDLEEPKVNWRNFRKACQIAKQTGALTAMITGKGEPTLFPKQITKYLDALSEFDFPMIELQTNGVLIAENEEEYGDYLNLWYEKGMTTISISVVHYMEEKNREVYLPYKKDYINLEGLTKTLHEHGFSVRLSCTLIDKYISTKQDLEKLIFFSKENQIEQMTIRPVNKPKECTNTFENDWIANNYLKDYQLKEIKDYLDEKGKLLMGLDYGGKIYDVFGQNVCLSNSLTIKPEKEEIRQLIFFPDGHIRYDWQYGGAILI